MLVVCTMFCITLSALASCLMNAGKKQLLLFFWTCSCGIFFFDADCSLFQTVLQSAVSCILVHSSSLDNCCSGLDRIHWSAVCFKPLQSCVEYHSQLAEPAWRHTLWTLSINFLERKQETRHKMEVKHSVHVSSMHQLGPQSKPYYRLSVFCWT